MRELLRPIARLVKWLLRPLVRRYDAHLTRLLGQVIREANVETCVYELSHLSNVREELLHHIGTVGRRLETATQRDPRENEVVLDSLLRELIRLQRRVDLIAEIIAAGGLENRLDTTRELPGRERRERQVQAA